MQALAFQSYFVTKCARQGNLNLRIVSFYDIEMCRRSENEHK